MKLKKINRPFCRILDIGKDQTLFTAKMSSEGDWSLSITLMFEGLSISILLSEGEETTHEKVLDQLDDLDLRKAYNGTVKLLKDQGMKIV